MKPIPQRWQTWRTEISSADTQLTNYNQADLTDAVKAKMIDVTGYPAFAFRILGTDTDGDKLVSPTISAWMDPFREDAGPGIRVWAGHATALVLGSKKFTGVPLDDGKWTSREWFEVDTYTAAIDILGVEIQVSANKEGQVIMPTYGFTHFLLEIPSLAGGSTNVDIVGVMWRPIPQVVVTV